MQLLMRVDNPLLVMFCKEYTKAKEKRKVIINVCIIIITTALVGWDCFEMPIAATLVL